MADANTTTTAPAAQAPAQPAAGQAAPKKKAGRLPSADIMRLGDWLRGHAKRLVDAGISAAGVARAATAALKVEVTVNTVTNVAAGCGIAFPEVSSADRLAKMEDVVLRVMFTPSLQAGPAQASATLAAAQASNNGQGSKAA